MEFVAVVLAYLLGSVPAGAWVARARGVDIQKVGSGNTGATNILRALGWKPALLVASFDVLKGALAVLLARLLLGDPFVAALCGVAAVLGHNYSVFLRLRGGKGVATSFGTLLVISPPVGLAAMATGIFCMYITKYVSAGSMVAAVTAAAVVVALERPLWMVAVVFVLSGLVVWQHRSNIERLRAGNERRLGEKVVR